MPTDLHDTQVQLGQGPRFVRLPFLVPESGLSAMYLRADEYESELERMNAAMIAENQGLQNDNKQLNTLIKEYEQTLETLMS